MEKLKFYDLDYIYEDESLVIRPDSTTNLMIDFSHIEEIQMSHTGRRGSVPCMIIKMNTGEIFQIDGFSKWRSSSLEREGYRDFVIDFHKQLKPYHRKIKFIGGINLPKPASAILAVTGAGLFAYNMAQEFASEKGMSISIIAMVVGLVTFFTSGHQYDPNKIPGKYLK